MSRVPTNIAEHVGRTPVVQLTRIAPDLDVELFAKLEALNPGGSVKDRIGVAMIEAAEREGLIEPGVTTIVEATSGNTGIALAFVCAAKGYRLVLTMPQGMSREREGLLRLYGATVEVTESLGGMNEAVDAARALAKRGDVFLPDQFSNPANPEIHRRTTGPEIWDALDGRVDAFVAGVGTGGTITGAGEALKARNPGCRIVAVEPSASAVLSGGRPGPHKIQGIGAGFVPAVLNREILDEVIGGRRRGGDRHGSPPRPARGRAGWHLGRGGGVGRARAGAAGRVARRQDRGDPARFGRAVRVDAVLRAVDHRRRVRAAAVATGRRGRWVCRARINASAIRAATPTSAMTSRSQAVPPEEGAAHGQRLARRRADSGNGGDKGHQRPEGRRRYALSMPGLRLIARTAAEIRRDVKAAKSRDPAARDVGTIEILATWPGVHAVLAHRLAHALYGAGVPLLPRAIAALARALTGIEIHPAAGIGEGLVHRSRDGSGDRRDVRDRRRRHAVSGGDARAVRALPPASATRPSRTTSRSAPERSCLDRSRSGTGRRSAPTAS